MSEETFLSIYRESLGPLYAFVARRVGGERALAEDVVQETWLRAVRDWARAEPPDAPLAWLRTVARNLVLNHFRARRSEAVSPLQLQACLEAGGPGGGELEPGAAQLLAFGLARLRADQAELLEAFHLEGLGLRALAERTGLSERAVEGRLARARQALRGHLEPLVHPSGGPS